MRRGRDVLSRIDLIRVSDRVLGEAGLLRPPAIRSLDAIHLATARLLEGELGGFVTYDGRMAGVGKDLGLRVVTPA